MKNKAIVTDIADKILNVGDEVAFIMPGCLYLRVGKIVDFTPKMAKIEFDFMSLSLCWYGETGKRSTFRPCRC